MHCGQGTPGSGHRPRHGGSGEWCGNSSSGWSGQIQRMPRHFGHGLEERPRALEFTMPQPHLRQRSRHDWPRVLALMPDAPRNLNACRISDASVSGRQGLVRKTAHPAARACSPDGCMAQAVSTMINVECVRTSARSRRTSSRPSKDPDICTPVTTTSAAPARRKASSVVWTSTVANPHKRKELCRRSCDRLHGPAPIGRSARLGVRVEPCRYLAIQSYPTPAPSGRAFVTPGQRLSRACAIASTERLRDRRHADCIPAGSAVRWRRFEERPSRLVERDVNKGASKESFRARPALITGD